MIDPFDAEQASKLEADSRYRMFTCSDFHARIVAAADVVIDHREAVLLEQFEEFFDDDTMFAEQTSPSLQRIVAR